VSIVKTSFSQIKKRKIATPKERAVSIAKDRITIILVCFAFVWAGITAGLSYVSWISDGAFKPVNRSKSYSENIIKRSDILDRNGSLLATAIPTASLCVNTKHVLDAEEARQKLKALFPELDNQRLRRAFESSSSCAMIKRHLSPEQQVRVNSLGIVGLEFLPDERRVYPVSNLAVHVVGYSDIDNNGLAGIERFMNDRLQQDLSPLELSLDLRVQTIMHRELSEAMKEFNAEAAVGLIMDIATGEVISMVSLPDFDPSKPARASDEQKFNRVTLGVYEMGSSFKIFNTALALETGEIKIGDVFETAEPIHIGGFSIKDMEKHKHSMSVSEIFIVSSNIGSAKMARKFGAKKQRAFLERLGLTEKISIELMEVGTPLLPPKGKWSDISTMTISFGHGIAVNALQLAAAAATIINDGHFVNPTLIKKTGETVKDTDAVVSPATSNAVRALMRLVVKSGTGRRANADGYMVGGKTGTADIVAKDKKYSTDARRASFVAAFPIDKPRYLVFAFLDNPKRSAKTFGYATAGWTVAPAVRNIISQAAPMLGVLPIPEEELKARDDKIIAPVKHSLSSE